MAGNKESFLENGLYKEVSNQDGISTAFRKFESRVWIVQFNAKGVSIGMVCVPTNDLAAIYGAPSIPAGDGNTPQRLKGVDLE